MSFPKSFPIAALTLALTGFTHPCVAADDGSLATTNRPAGLATKLKSEEMSGGQSVKRAYIEFGTNQYAFVIPFGFRMESSPEKIDMVNADFSCFISFRLASTALPESRDMQGEYCRALLLKEFPGAKIKDEFSQGAATRVGPAFDFQWKNSQISRVAYIPNPAGFLEFSVTTRAEKFTEGLYFYNWVIGSFASNEKGKLEVNRASNAF